MVAWREGDCFTIERAEGCCMKDAKVDKQEKNRLVYVKKDMAFSTMLLDPI